MKAAQIDEYGDVSVLQVRDVDTPSLKPGQVLVEVHAAGLNPFDTTVRSGKTKDSIPLSLPVTLGGDIAGVVTELGEGVSSLAIGDKVYGQANVVAGNSGAFAEYAATSADQLAAMPVNMDFHQAASIPLVGVSAIQAITEHLNLKSGQKLFIHGGAGGIGSIAIQIAKHIGAYVATTATGEGVDYVKSLGANEVIDYKAKNFATVLHDFDVVFDTVGGNEFDKALDVLKSGGTAVSMIAKADEARVSELGITAITQATTVNTEKLNTLRELIESGIIESQVDKVFPLEQIREAFEAREGGSIKGKVVIAIR